MTTEALLAEAHWVRRLAHALVRDPALAEDVAQDTLAAAIEKPPAIDAGDGGRLRAWLGGVVRRTAASAVRDRVRRRRREERAARPEADGLATDDSERLELHQQLLDAVRGLAEPYRSAVVMRYFDELSPRAIAQRKGLKPATVRQHLARGLAQLRHKLDRDFDGGRAAWTRAAVGLLEGGATTGLFWTSWMALMMSSSTKKTAAAAAVLIACGLGLWALISGPDAAPPGGGPAPGSTLAAAAAETTGATPDTPRPATDRVAVAAPTEAGFVGVVVDARGDAIPGASIACVSSPELTPADFKSFAEALERARAVEPETRTETDADGGFRIEPPEDGDRFEIRVAARGHRRMTEITARPVDGDTDLGALRLRPATILRGRVVDATGRAVGGAVVRRLDAAQGDVSPEGMGDDPEGGGELSDAEGRFALLHARPGPFVLRATHPEHPPGHLTDQHAPPGDVVDNLIVVLEVGSTITGRITGAPAGAPVEILARSTAGNPFGSKAIGMLETVLGFDSADTIGQLGVVLRSRSTHADENGRFELRGLRTGQRYKIWAVEKRSGTPQKITCSDGARAVAGARDVELTYDPGASVRFRVTDAATGAPITELSVRPQLAGDNGIADAMASLFERGERRHYTDGVVELSHLRKTPDQELSIHVTALGYEAHEHASVPLPVRGACDLGEIALRPAPILSVLVTDGDRGTPVANARVMLTRRVDSDSKSESEEADEGEGSRKISFSTSYSLTSDGSGTGNGRGDFWKTLTTTDLDARYALTDSSGRCKLNSFAGERARIVIETAAHAPHTAILDLPGDENAHHDARVTGGGTVEVRVVDPGQQPLTGVSILHEAPADIGSTTGARTTDGRGVARFEHLAAGEHSFRIEPEKDSALNVAVQVTDKDDSTGRAALGWHTASVEDDRTASVVITVQPRAVLTGTVTAGGTPLERARIQLLLGPSGEAAAVEGLIADILAPFAEELDGMRSTQTDIYGYFRLAGVPAGEHRLRITQRGRAMATVIPVVVQAPGGTFDIALDTTAVEGRVTDAQGEPVRNARVSIVGVTGTEMDSARSAIGMISEGLGLGSGADGVRTDSDGRYVLRGVQAGAPFVVAVQASGHQPATSGELRVERGATQAGIDLTLAPAGRIRVVVRGSTDLLGAVSANRIAAPGDEPTSRAGLLRRGRAMLRGLRPGTWRVTLTGDNEAERQEQTVEVVAGRRSDVEFTR